jgi:hypothetical protein
MFYVDALWRGGVSLLCSVCMVSATVTYTPQEAQQPQQQEQAAKIPDDQLDSLVAPVALYPDPLLAQVLAASTYPLELIQLNQWLGKHKDLKDKALADAVQKEGWDASVQGLAGLPDVVKRLADDVKWTTDLGNAFLAQQSDVMSAVQRMRKKAQDKGLKSNEQMKVETQTVENKQVIVIQQANPQVIQVPSYDPVVVYGPPPYPYPPVYYPPPPPSGWAVAGGMALSFGVGVAMGAMWSGGWGYNCGWHGGNNDITINNNNNFNRNVNRNTNVNSGNRTGNSWQHNPQHRGGTPYSNKATANKYGGTARGDSMASRQANARQNQSQVGNRQQAGTMDRSGQDRGGRQQGGDRQQGGGTDRGNADRGGRQQGSIGDGGGRGGGGGDRVGDRSVSAGSGGSSRSGAFSDASRGGSSARASSSRGASSMGSRGGGRRR